MSANVSNQTAYLRTSRQFPEDLQKLALEVNKTYVDIANAVNSRTIGTFSANRPAVTGENWFITNQRQQGLRQIYTFTTTGNIPHGLSFTSISQFTKPSGSFTDGTNYYGAIYASNVAIPGQVTFYITPTDIVVLAGVGAPAITKGIIILEWISNV
jgi:hypothetical protein